MKAAPNPSFVIPSKRSGDPERSPDAVGTESKGARSSRGTCLLALSPLQRAKGRPLSWEGRGFSPAVINGGRSPYLAAAGPSGGEAGATFNQ